MPIGIISALRPRSLIDRGGMVFVLIGISAHPRLDRPDPAVLLRLQAGHRRRSPATATSSTRRSGATCGGPVQWAYHMILPWATFVMLFAALYVAHDPGEHDGDDERGLRAHRPRQGCARAQVHPLAHPPQQHAARSSPCSAWTSASRSAARSSRRRSSACPGLGQLDRSSAYENFDLPVIVGRRRVRDRRDHPLQSDRRHRLRGHRSEDPAHLTGPDARDCSRSRPSARSFKTDDGIVQAVDGVSLLGRAGQTLGIVGESGCWQERHAASRSMGLNDRAERRRRSGEARVRRRGSAHRGSAQATQLRELRGSEIAMIFQDPMTSLNPVKSIGWQLDGGRVLHQRRDAEGGAGPARSRRSTRSGSRAPSAGSTTTRTSSRAACASA